MIKLKLILGAVALVLCLLLANYISGLRKDNANLNIQVGVLSSHIKTQNDAVEKLKKAGDDRLKLAAADLKRAREAAKIAKAQSVIIYREQPAIPGDLCQSALELVNKQK